LIIRNGAGSQHDPAAFRVDVHPQRDAVRVVATGALDVANAGVLQARLDKLRSAGIAHVVLDLRELTSMDLAAARMILREDRRARSKGWRFSLIKGIPAAQRVLDLSGVSDRLEFGPPPPPASLIGSARSRHVDLDRPNLGIAFQCYLAELRQEGRAARRLSGRHRRR
jgi:anti-anti-sigma factor